MPGEGNDVLADFQQTLRKLTMLLGVGLFTLVGDFSQFSFPSSEEDHKKVRLKKRQREAHNMRKKMAELETKNEKKRDTFRLPDEEEEI